MTNTIQDQINAIEKTTSELFIAVNNMEDDIAADHVMAIIRKIYKKKLKLEAKLYLLNIA